MLRFFQRILRKREICFHEDDYCRQQFLPKEAAAYANAELKKIEEFANAHRAPGGIGWTDIYVRKEAPVELRSLKIQKASLATAISSFLPPFDTVYTGDGNPSRWQRCERAAAWGKSSRCALFADWDDGGVVNIWMEFFEQDEESIIAATRAAIAVGKLHPLIYVDWAWGYVCEVSDEQAFASMLRTKLKTIAERNVI